jgi:tryptophan-rich hypothetical protein
VNKINPKKLLNSKWTAQSPQNKEKHFIVTDVEYNEDGEVCACELEAILSKRQQYIDWEVLKDSDLWKQGWVS